MQKTYWIRCAHKNPVPLRRERLEKIRLDLIQKEQELESRQDDIRRRWNDFFIQKAIIESVEKVTHIAPEDENGELIGVAIEQFGVCNYDCKGLSLCAGITDAKYVTTTEVYPDSPKSDEQNCIDAQVAAICGGLNYLQSL